MELGRLDRKITLEFKTAGQSASGEPTEAWGNAVQVWARRQALSGREYYAALAAQIVAEEMMVFTLRYRADVRPNTARILDEGRTYDVRRVAEIGRREALAVYADTQRA